MHHFCWTSVLRIIHVSCLTILTIISHIHLLGNPSLPSPNSTSIPSPLPGLLLTMSTLASHPLLTSLTPHLALITGATGGIGHATCLALASLGCSIAVHYHTAADTATSLVSALKAKNVRAAAFRADLSTYEGVRSLHAEVVGEMGDPTVSWDLLPWCSDVRPGVVALRSSELDDDDGQRHLKRYACLLATYCCCQRVL